MIVITILLRTHPRITIKTSRRKVPRLTPRLKRVHPTRDTRQHYFLLRRSNVRRTNLNLPTDTSVTPTTRRHITISEQAIDAELCVARSVGLCPLLTRRDTCLDIRHADPIISSLDQVDVADKFRVRLLKSLLHVDLRGDRLDRVLCCLLVHSESV